MNDALVCPNCRVIGSHDGGCPVGVAEGQAVDEADRSMKPTATTWPGTGSRRVTAMVHSPGRTFWR